MFYNKIYKLHILYVYILVLSSKASQIKNMQFFLSCKRAHILKELISKSIGEGQDLLLTLSDFHL